MAGSSDIRAGRAFIELTLQDKGLLKGLQAAQARLRAFGEGMKVVGAATLGAGLALKGILTAAVVKFAESSETLEKMAQRTGVAVEALSELGYAAQQSGGDLDTLESSLKKMQRSLGNAFEGNQQAVESLERLGLSLDDLRGKAPDAQFEAIADKIAAIGDPTMRAALAMQIFGKNGTALLPMLANGRAGIEAFRKEARDLGLSRNAGDVKMGATLAEGFKRLTAVVSETVNAIGSALAPAMIQVVNSATRIGVAIHKWIDGHRELISLLSRVAGGVVAVSAAMVGLGFAAEHTGISTMIGLLGSLLSPLGLIAAALGAAGFAWLKFTTAGKNAWATISNTLNGIRALFSETFGGIVDALSAGDLGLAAKIGLAGLKVAWEEVSNFIQLKLLEIKKFWFETWSGMVALLGGVIEAVKQTAMAIQKAITGAIQAPIYLQKAEESHEAFERLYAAHAPRIKAIQAERDKILAGPDANSPENQKRLADLDREEKSRKGILKAANDQTNKLNDMAQDAVGATSPDLMKTFRQGFQSGAQTDPETEKQIADLKARIAAMAGAGDSPAIAAAKAQLDALRKQAATAAGAAKVEDEKRQAAHKDQMTGAGEGMAVGNQKVVGAIGAAAAMVALGGGQSPQEKIAKHAANTEKHTAVMAAAMTGIASRMAKIETVLGQGMALT